MFFKNISTLEIAFISSLYWTNQIIEAASNGVNFKIQPMTQCPATNSAFRTMYGISFEECVRECGARKRCDSVDFFRTRQTCVLTSFNAVKGTKKNRTSPCFHVKKEDILTVSPCACSLGEVCVDGPMANTCAVKDCMPSSVAHGVIRGNRLSIGSVLKYQCHNGFEPAGQTAITCLGTGIWTTQPVCLRDCGEPADGSHASLLPGDTIAGSKRTYVCNPGYVLTSGSYLTSLIVECMHTGQWSSDAVECTPNCAEPAAGTHASLLPGDTIVGSMRTYVCSPGYVLTSGSYISTITVECMNTGRWSSEAVECEPIIARTCADWGATGMVQSGMFEVDPRLNGQSVMVNCDFDSKSGKATTVLNHDKEARTLISGYEEPGSYNIFLNYYIGLDLASAVVDLSRECKQYLVYDCHHAKLTNNVYWRNRHGHRASYFNGSPPPGKRCTCGNTNSCVSGDYECNCDKNDRELRKDAGYVRVKSELPISGFEAGDTGDSEEYAYHTLGPLLCT